MGITAKGEITRNRVVQGVLALIHEQGYKSTSISDIIRVTGVKKGNLYFHFPSKEAIGLAVLEEVGVESAAFLEKSLKGETPMSKIANYLDAVFVRHKNREFIGGCMIGNTAIEMSDSNPLFAAKVAQIFTHWKVSIAHILYQAQVVGELENSMTSEKLAHHMVAVIEGGIMMAKVTKDEKDLKICLDSLRLILGLKNRGRRP